MKRYFIIITALIFGFIMHFQNLYAQKEGLTDKEKRKIEKMEKKEARQKQIDAKKNLYEQLIEHRMFVLEADELSNTRGERAYVSSNLNFIMVDSNKAVIQIGSMTGVGANGVGGVTAEGQITKFEVKSKEKKDITYINMNVSTALGFYQVHFTITPRGNTTAMLTSAVRGGNLTFHGDLKPIQSARIYKGNSY